MLVFALYKREAARLEQFLQRNNYDAVAVHGDKGQVQIIAFLFLVVFLRVVCLFFLVGGGEGEAHWKEAGVAWLAGQGSSDSCMYAPANQADSDGIAGHSGRKSRRPMESN